MFMAAMLCRPLLPVNRAPPMIGIGTPSSDRPMRRVKKRSTVRPNPPPPPTLNMPAFSRKKSRFSGKKSAKRVRLTCSSSTSTWAKSVFTVRSRLSPDATPYLTSMPYSLNPDGSRRPPTRSCRPPASMYGVSRRSRPRLTAPMPVRVPAWLTRVSVYSFEIGAQKICSFLRRMLRMKLAPQICESAAGKRRVTIGIAISATHPSAVRRATAFQTPSQSTLTFGLLLPRKPPSPSSATCCSSLAPSGLMTNM